MKLSITLLLSLLLGPSLSARPDPNHPKATTPAPRTDEYSDPGGWFGGGGSYGGGYGYYPGAPPVGYGIPGGGYGGGYYFPGGPPGGYGIPGGGYGGGFSFPGDRPSMVCKEWGPCRMKRLRCPNKCFHSFHRKGKGYAYGGAGGGCTFDCTRCLAYC